MATAVPPAGRRLAVPAWTVASSALALTFGLLCRAEISTRFAPERTLDHGRRWDDG